MASLVIQLAVYAAGAMLSAVVVNLISQLFLPKSDEPPVVPHWVPFIGNAVAYGMDPYNFLVRCQKKVLSPNQSCLTIYFLRHFSYVGKH